MDHFHLHLCCSMPDSDSGGCLRCRQISSRRYCTENRDDADSSEHSLMKQIVARIKINGPITVADYMREVLLNPTAVSHWTVLARLPKVNVGSHPILHEIREVISLIFL